MKQSKAGCRLTPELKAVCDQIYYRSPKRYARLVHFVWWAQSHKWPDEAIAQALRLADPHIDTVDNWWTYCTYLLPKAKGQATEKESDKFKSEIAEFADEFMEFVRAKKRDPNRLRGNQA